MTWRNRSVFRGRQHGLWERHRNLDTREKPLNARSRHLHIDGRAKHSVRSKPVSLSGLWPAALSQCSGSVLLGRAFLTLAMRTLGANSCEGSWISIDSRRRPDQGETHGALGDARLSAANAVATRSESSDGGHARPPRRVDTGQRRGMFCSTRR